MKKRVHVIINPAAGNDEPILSYLNTELNTPQLEWDVSITKSANDANKIATGLIGKVDLIAVYGGDGTVMEVARALYHQVTPMAILPGGTANVMAKDLGIPTNTIEAIQLLKPKSASIQKIDMGICNDVPFLIRINIGFLADMVKSTTRASKDKWGSMAYNFNAIKNIITGQRAKYKMVLDGKRVTATGAALVIANSGNIGTPGLSLVPEMYLTDGKLDIVLIKKTNIPSLINIGRGIIMDQQPEKPIRRWQVQEAIIKTIPKQTIVSDDEVLKSTELHVKVDPEAINIAVPLYTSNNLII